MIADSAAARTRLLARGIGPYLVVVAITLLARQRSLWMLLPAFMEDAPLVLVTGAFTLMAGLAILVAHPHWRGARAIAVSGVGLAAAAKGAWLMLAPQLGAELTAAVAINPAWLLVAAGLDLLLGLWLSWVGWGATA